MPSLTAWLYPTAFGAETGELQLKTLIERDAIQLHDAAIVVWMQHDKAPIVRRVKHRGSKAAGKGAVFGGLVGLLVLNPGAGAAIGAGAGAAAQRLHGTGLDAQFVADVREQLKPGTSALLVLSSGADADAVRAFVARTEAVLVHAELSEEGRRVLEASGLPSPDPEADTPDDTGPAGA